MPDSLSRPIAVDADWQKHLRQLASNIDHPSYSMGKLTNDFRHATGVHRLYRRSRTLAFLVDYCREARRLRLNPRESNDQAHVIGTWSFDNPIERAWQSHALATVAAHAGAEPWGDALEIGCSEGVFTAQLASRCRSVNGYDISPLAVARAAERCRPYSNVRILERDAAGEEIEGQYDLVFVMDVLWTVLGEERRASAIPRLANAVRDGGLLVFSDSRLPWALRGRLWSRFLPQGADEWAKILERTPGLKRVHQERYCYPAGEDTAEYWDKLLVLFRKGAVRDV